MPLTPPPNDDEPGGGVAVAPAPRGTLAPPPSDEQDAALDQGLAAFDALNGARSSAHARALAPRGAALPPADVTEQQAPPPRRTPRLGDFIDVPKQVINQGVASTATGLMGAAKRIGVNEQRAPDNGVNEALGIPNVALGDLFRGFRGQVDQQTDASLLPKTARFAGQALPFFANAPAAAVAVMGNAEEDALAAGATQAQADKSAALQGAAIAAAGPIGRVASAAAAPLVRQVARLAAPVAPVVAHAVEGTAQGAVQSGAGVAGQSQYDPEGAAQAARDLPGEALTFGAVAGGSHAVPTLAGALRDQAGVWRDRVTGRPLPETVQEAARLASPDQAQVLAGRAFGQPDAQTIDRAQPPGAPPRLWSQIQREQELAAVDPRAQRLADEEREGASPAGDAIGQAATRDAAEQAANQERLESMRQQAERQAEQDEQIRQAMESDEGERIARQRAQDLLAEQQNAAAQIQARADRRQAFLMRENLSSADDPNVEGSHVYDQNGRLVIDPNTPNPFYLAPRRMRDEAAAFVREHLGDDQGAHAADDPTIAEDVRAHRMQEKPLPDQMAAGLRRDGGAPEPVTAEHLLGMGPADRRTAFRSMTMEQRQAIQPEFARLVRERGDAGAENPRARHLRIRAAREAAQARINQITTEEQSHGDAITTETTDQAGRRTAGPQGRPAGPRREGADKGQAGEGPDQQARGDEVGPARAGEGPAVPDLGTTPRQSAGGEQQQGRPGLPVQGAGRAQAGREVPGGSQRARVDAQPVRNLADLHQGFRDIYGLRDDEAAAAVALVRARAEALGVDPDTFARQRISEVRRGKGSPSFNQNALMQERQGTASGRRPHGPSRGDGQSEEADFESDRRGADAMERHLGAQRIRAELAETLGGLDRVPLVRARNVPYGMGMDPAGTKAFIDPDFKPTEKLKVTGRVVDTIPPTMVHEITETRWMKRGMSYERAHDIANAVEREYLRGQGLSKAEVDAYEREIEPTLRKTRDYTGPVPAELNRKPYQEEGETDLLRPPTTLHQDDVDQLRDASGGASGRVQKGAISFAADGRAVIHALKAPDVSTAVHELGHLFRRTLADREQKIAGRWAGARRAADGSFEWTRPAEEKFARGFERWVRDGQAPVPALAKVFQQFKDWLGSIYRSVTGSPIDVDITPEIRDLFDRMFKPAGDQAARAPEIAAGVAGAQPRPEPEPRPAAVAGPAERAAAPAKPLGVANQRPDLAIPTDDPATRKAYVKARNAMPDAETQARQPVRELAAQDVAKDPEGIQRTLLDLHDQGQAFNEHQMAQAQELLKRLRQRAGGNSSDFQRLAVAYQTSGTTAGRAMGMRQDQLQTPEGRLEEAATIVGLPREKRARNADKLRQDIRELEKKASLLYQSEPDGARKLQSRIKRLYDRLDRLHEQDAKILAADKAHLKELGFDIDHPSPEWAQDPEQFRHFLGALEATRGGLPAAMRETYLGMLHMSGLVAGKKIIADGIGIPRLALQRHLEAAFAGAKRIATGQPLADQASAGELAALWKGIGPNLALAARNAWDTLKTERLPRELVGDEEMHQFPAIRGLKGKIFRHATLFTTVRTIDSFTRSFVANMEAHAQAYRSAVGEDGQRLTGDALASHIQKELTDYTSDSWSKARQTAMEATFTEKPPELVRMMNRFKYDKANTVTRKTLKVLANVLVPFSTIPSNIAKQGLRDWTPGLSDAGVIAGALTRRAATGELGYDPNKFNAGVAQAVLRWSAFLAMGSVAGSGLITGADDERNPLSVNLFGHHFSYANLGPVARVIGAAADWYSPHAHDTAKAKAGRALGGAWHQFGEMPMLRLGSDLVHAAKINDGWLRFAADKSGGFVEPSIAHQAITAQQDEIRAKTKVKGDGIDRFLGYLHDRVAGNKGRPVYVDGRPLVKDSFDSDVGTLMWRMFSPFTMGTKDAGAGRAGSH